MTRYVTAKDAHGSEQAGREGQARLRILQKREVQPGGQVRPGVQFEEDAVEDERQAHRPQNVGHIGGESQRRQRPERPGEELHEEHAGKVTDIAGHPGKGDAHGALGAEHLRGHGDVAAIEDMQKADKEQPPKEGREAAANAGRQQFGAQVAPRAGAQNGGHGKAAV